MMLVTVGVGQSFLVLYKSLFEILRTLKTEMVSYRSIYIFPGGRHNQGKMFRYRHVEVVRKRTDWVGIDPWL
jgi:hypothetical protein